MRSWLDPRTDADHDRDQCERPAGTIGGAAPTRRPDRDEPWGRSVLPTLTDLWDYLGDFA